MAGIASIQAQNIEAGGGAGVVTDVTAGTRISVAAMGTVRQVTALVTRPLAIVFVGAASDPAIVPDGSAYAPFPEIADALVWIATQPQGQYDLVCAPQDYADFVVPPGYSLVFTAGVSSPGAAHVGSVTLTGTSGGGFPAIFRGFVIDNVDTATDGGMDPQAVFVLLESGSVGPISNAAAIGLSVIGAGMLEASNLIISVVFTGVVNVGAGGFCVFHNADVQQPVTAEVCTFVDCKVPSAVTLNGAGPLVMRECEGDPFPSPTVVTFGSPGLLVLDSMTTREFVLASCSVVNGLVAIDDVGAYLGAQAGATALTSGTPVFPFGGQLVPIDGSLESMQRFVGFAQLTSSAAGDAQIVASEGAFPAGLGALTSTRTYYVSGAIVSGSPMRFFSSDDLPTFLAGAPLDSWYRQVGVSIGGEFVHAWGAPQATVTTVSGKLSGTYAVPSTSFSNVGLSLVVPPGEWSLTFDVRNLVNVSAGNGFLRLRLYDTTAGAVVVDSETQGVLSATPAAAYGGTTPITKNLTLAVTSTIDLQAARDAVAVYNDAQVIGDSEGWTRGTAVRRS